MVPSVAPMPLVAEHGNVHVVLRLIQPHAVVLVMRKKSNNADLPSVLRDSQRVTYNMQCLIPYKSTPSKTKTT